MIRKLLFALAVLLTAGLASAQPNLSYSFVRDNQNIPVIGKGIRPTVTGEMGIPIGTPFFDTTDNALYYWSGSAWTAVGNSTSGTIFSGPILLPDGTTAAPSLSFTSDPDTGLERCTTNTLCGIAGGARHFSISTSGFGAAANGDIFWLGQNADVVLARDAAATLQMGGDAASAVSQTFKGADSTGNGTAGGVLTVRGGAGTAGDAKGGNLNLAGGAAFGAGEQGVVAIVDTGTKPTCAAGLRGGFWYEQGGAGVADTFEVCAKAGAGDTYAWRTLATIP